jgi:hypothetical protein
LAERSDESVTDTDQIFQAIRTLPVPERLRLIERVVHDLADVSADAQRSALEPESLLGLFADEPELIDDVCRMAMDARKRDTLRTGGGSDEGAP